MKTSSKMHIHYQIYLYFKSIRSNLCHYLMLFWINNQSVGSKSGLNALMFSNCYCDKSAARITVSSLWTSHENTIRVFL